jgi:hypothetical protein
MGLREVKALLNDAGFLYRGDSLEQAVALVLSLTV